MDLKTLIGDTVREMVQNAPTETRYREPLVGFAAASDPLFQAIKDHIGEDYLLPQDLLADAQTVVSYFVPFDEAVILSNRSSGSEPSPIWLKAYVETNNLLSAIGTELIKRLGEEGVQGVTMQPTHNFNRETLLARWSHKHTAYVAGLGTFGHNHLLITKAGSGGRFGSLVIDYLLPPTPRLAEEYCLRKAGKSCSYCINHCPVSAIEVDGYLDKAKCYAHLQQFGQRLPELGKCDACGKCTVGPCAILATAQA